MSVQVPPEFTWWAARPFRERLGQVQANVTATSWYRDPVRNARVGGAPLSQHQLGAAADFVGTRSEVDRVIAGARRAGLVPVRTDYGVHVQLWPAASNPLRFYGFLSASSPFPGFT